MEQTYFNDTNNALGRLQRALESVNERHRQMRRERKQLWDKVEELQRARQEADATLTTRQEETIRQQALLSELHDTLRQQKADLAEALTKNATLEAELLLRAAIIKDRDNTIEQLRKSNSEARSYKTRSDELEAENEDLKKNSESLQNQIQALQSEHQAQLTALQSRLEFTDTEVEKRIHEFQRLNMELTAQSEEARQALASARSHAEETAAELVSVKERHAVAQQSLEELQEQTQQLRLQLDSAVAHQSNQNHNPLAGDDRAWIIEQINAAIAMIDMQLQEN